MKELQLITGFTVKELRDIIDSYVRKGWKLIQKDERTINLGSKGYKEVGENWAVVESQERVTVGILRTKLKEFDDNCEIIFRNKEGNRIPGEIVVLSGNGPCHVYNELGALFG